MDIHLKFTEFCCFFGPKKFQVKKRLDQNNFGCKQMLGPKTCWGQKNYESKKVLGSKKMMDPKKMIGPKK